MFVVFGPCTFLFAKQFRCPCPAFAVCHMGSFSRCTFFQDRSGSVPDGFQPRFIRFTFCLFLQRCNLKFACPTLWLQKVHTLGPSSLLATTGPRELQRSSKTSRRRATPNCVECFIQSSMRLMMYFVKLFISLIQCAVQEAEMHQTKVPTNCSESQQFDARTKDWLLKMPSTQG